MNLFSYISRSVPSLICLLISSDAIIAAPLPNIMPPPVDALTWPAESPTKTTSASLSTMRSLLAIGIKLAPPPILFAPPNTSATFSLLMNLSNAFFALPFPESIPIPTSSISFELGQSHPNNPGEIVLSKNRSTTPSLPPTSNSAL